MTFWGLLRAVLRYWPIVVAGAVCTAAAGLAILSDEGVYSTRTEIVFLAPTSPSNPNALRTQSEDVIDMAGVVAKRLTGPGEVPKFAAPDVTLVGLGVRDGWSLRLPDTGGQWSSNFATQRLVLDIVGPTTEAVRERQDELLDRVQGELSALQSERGVADVNRITALAAPETTVIAHVGGSRPRALAMTLALGVGAILTGVLVLERRRLRREFEQGSLLRHGEAAAPARSDRQRVRR
ncbi:hypothetical protein NQ152_11825 [Microbacterium sp. zg.B48]|uniref:hypothetical protein n=1 Tax=Microbacterium sp. zg.B48 TaxID=2969408 RepID=UPI00214B6540|nr:hypothetical protein [Microbacterium sp. zg.B48]MCR2764191.1 hypothetical protein [Microbacterium sp. zg.B48]